MSQEYNFNLQYNAVQLGEWGFWGREPIWLVQAEYR